MTKFVTAVLALVLFAAAVQAQGWEKTADLGLIINQSTYSDSWDGDELGTFNWTAVANLNANRHLSASTLWQNQLKLSYGAVKNEYFNDEGDRDWGDSEKANDRVFLESLVKFAEDGYVNPYVALTLDTQFHDADDNLFNPALLTESAGIGRDLIKNEETHLFSRVGFAYRQRFIKDADTVHDGGIEWVTDLSHVFNEQLKVVSKLSTFKAFASDNDELTDDWKTVDVAWETTLSASVSKYVQTSLFFELKYDKEIDSDVRYREILGLGVTYKLF